MYEVNHYASFELAPETKALMAEVFAGRMCVRCNKPAVRLAGERFYCADHYQRKQSHAARTPKVYRCGIAIRD